MRGICISETSYEKGGRKSWFNWKYKGTLSPAAPHRRSPRRRAPHRRSPRRQAPHRRSPRRRALSQPISSPEPFAADLFAAVLLAGELVTPSPYKVVAGEANGSGKFGQAEGSAYLLRAGAQEVICFLWACAFDESIVHNQCAQVVTMEGEVGCIINEGSDPTVTWRSHMMMRTGEGFGFQSHAAW